MRGNKPVVESDRIVIEDKVTKIKLINIADKTGNSMKNTVIRLVDEEYKKLKEGVVLKEYKVIAEDNLYFGRIGERIVQTYATVVLSVEGENVVFNKNEVKEFKGEKWEK